MKSSIKSDVLEFYDEMQQTQHHRYRSWEHCYQFFSANPTDIDLASLHLAFYFASWGMYRGSSFLLQKDYQVHRPVVEEVMKPKYAPIRAITLQSLKLDSTNELSGMILDLVERIKESYSEYIRHDPDPINATDTLATKILMGTLGCTPAYDSYFICGLKHQGLHYSALNKKNFSELLNYCYKHESEFTEVQEEISNYGIYYPVMKVIDMHFWVTGKKVVKAMKKLPLKHL